jgi:ATP-dependent Clp protease ATP-binding subunit ClpA
MFERFTDQARRVVVLAQEEARMLGHGYIGTEHILLGLLSEGEGQAAQALAALEISLEAAREQVAEIIGEGTGQPAGHIPFTPRTKKVLELSLREAQRLGDGYIGTEHILLGLLLEGEGVAAQVLERLGATRGKVVAQLQITARSGPGEELRRVSAGRMMGPRPPVERLASLREVMSRLDEITERLTAIENLLAEMRDPAARPARKPASGGARKPPAGRRGPAGGARRKPPAGGAPPGQPEPPAAEA